MAKHLIVTGASGLIGRAVLREAERRGLPVTAWARRRPEGWSGAYQAYDLAGEPAAIDQPATILHLAADISNKLSADVEYRALDKLVEAENLDELIFVSSLSAINPASEYGERKAALEARTLAAGGRVVRPGLVTSRIAQGAFGFFDTVAARLPISIGIGGAQVQPISLESLARRLVDLTQTGDRQSGASNLCTGPVDMARFQSDLRRLRYRRGTWLELRLPRGLTLILAKFSPAAIGQRLKAFLNTPLAAIEAGDEALHPDDSLPGMRHAKRRRLLAEGRSLLSVFLGRSVPPALIRRYAVTLSGYDRSDALSNSPTGAIPSGVIQFGRGSGDQVEQEFKWRLSMAARIAEFSPQGARRFAPYEKRHWLHAFIRMGLLGTVAAFELVTRALFGGLIWRTAFGKPDQLRTAE
ncbi:NAD-dependent epimerase/dehydratase family protein [Maricaulis sp.]|uniref:SDR family oxidoreductase n=1 Tax=Maricaulis sp. TaxID=1486257 RepID=UPI002628F527|nr:NAD-dependent epimerase/dehydratase family protein [Maricaulis sp.]